MEGLERTLPQATRVGLESDDLAVRLRPVRHRGEIARVPLPLAVWSGILYTVRGIRKFRAIGASLTDEIFALPASGAEMETE